MKRLFLGLMLLAFMACAGFGQEQILYRDQFTIQYDPPATLPELLEGESLVYRIYLWDMAQGAPVAASTTGWIFYAETALLEQLVVTPPTPRRTWAVGVQLVHIRADLVETASYFAVTTKAEDVDPAGVPGVPFVYAPDGLLQPEKVLNLRDSGM